MSMREKKFVEERKKTRKKMFFGQRKTNKLDDRYITSFYSHLNIPDVYKIFFESTI